MCGGLLRRQNLQTESCLVLEVCQFFWLISTLMDSSAVYSTICMPSWVIMSISLSFNIYFASVFRDMELVTYVHEHPSVRSSSSGQLSTVLLRARSIQRCFHLRLLALPHTFEVWRRSRCPSSGDVAVSLLTMFYCDCFIVQSVGDQTGVTQLGFFVSARHCKAAVLAHERVYNLWQILGKQIH
ncbi:Hypothetical_protein [Hexamita inflata]|uniref:Hypothetical_protein n=1 Tax=Hexamita inflata TaxID=28002 RepID=A0AA86RUZ7_9EUKA|nr:Hypothetical protein HINF_LOCUS66187 [Hexamita inflata]